MAEASELLDRIDIEFSNSEKKIKEFQARQVEAYQGRQERLELFSKVCEQMRDIWRPKLETLARRFGDKVQVNPSISPTCRNASFRFQSPLAEIELRFTASTDSDVHHLVMDYDLHILPVLMKFDPHARLELPLNAVDVNVVGSWIDDRIIDFVRVFLSLHENQYYLKDHMVADPISGTQFPKYAAATKLDWNGATYYFIGEQTRSEFMAKNDIKS